MNAADTHCNPSRFPGITSLLLCLCLALVSCAPVTLVGPYDEVIDQGITQLHKDTTAFLLLMEQRAGKPLGEYRNNADFYIHALTEVASLQLRATNSPDNDLTIQQLALLKSSFRDLRVIHEAQERLGLNMETVTPLKSAMDIQFGAILKLEIAKKRGAE